jgi:hypothetical protein
MPKPCTKYDLVGLDPPCRSVEETPGWLLGLTIANIDKINRSRLAPERNGVMPASFGLDLLHVGDSQREIHDSA